MSFEDILELEKRNKDFIEEIKKNTGRMKEMIKEVAVNIKPMEPFTDIIILDLEHTDRKIIQICIKSMRTQKVFCSLVNPNCKIGGIVRDLTGIQQKDCDSAPTFNDLKATIAAFFDNGPVIVLAHNGRGCDFPIFIEALGSIPYTHLWVDSYNDLGNNFKKKLEEVEPSYSLFMDLHDAKVDVELLEMLIVRYWNSTISSIIDGFTNDRTKLKETAPDVFTVTHLRRIISQYGVSGISSLKKELLVNEYKKIQTFIA